MGMTMAVVISDPCVCLVRKKGEPEKEGGVETVRFLLMIIIGVCNRICPLLQY